MAVANPYFINIELFWPNGSRPNQNQIARVKAFDVNGSIVTEEGQSGFNPSTGGWQPVFMQNIAAFYPPREQPNLKFEVVNTAEQVAYTTQVFANIPSGSTVRIVIGQSATLVGGNFQVSGSVRLQSGAPLTAGTVSAYDVTNGSEALLGSVTLGAAGTYSITFSSGSFSSNGFPHVQPNLQVRVRDQAGQLLVQSALLVGASANEIVHLVVADSPSPPGQFRVFGDVRNGLGLPVAGIIVEAYHVAWTTAGLQEIPLGEGTSSGAGAYDIRYDRPTITTPSAPCGTPVGQMNLLVYAKELSGETRVTLASSGVIFNAGAEQRADLEVDRAAASTDSEYTRLHAALSPCLEGAEPIDKWNTLNLLAARPELLTFVAQSSGHNVALVHAYVRAWLIAGELFVRVPPPETPVNVKARLPEVMYALVRAALGETLSELLDDSPDTFFNTLVDSIGRNVVSASLEDDLEALVAYWRSVLATLMTSPGAPGSPPQAPTWQQQLLDLVFPDLPAPFPQVAATTSTPFGSDTTAHTVTLPAGIVAGDLLVALFANDGNATVTVTPNTWDALFAGPGGGNQVRLSAFAKVAEGNESGTALNFQTSAAEQGAAQIYRIGKDSWRGSLSDGVAAFGAPASGTGASIDPPVRNFPSGWGGVSAKALWIACAAHDGGPALSSSPAGYTPPPALRTLSSGSGGNCTLLSARREFLGKSEDPGAFGIAASEEWASQTFAVRPLTGIPQTQKKQKVAEAHHDTLGTFPELVTALIADGHLTTDEGANLTFAFELYDKVNRFYPLVAAIYPDKASRGWQTIEDLATVPLESTGGRGWISYAEQAAAINNGYPGDIPGNRPEEKARVWGMRLFELFGNTSPQDRYADEIATNGGPAYAPVADFLSDHPDFDLEHTNVDRYAAEHPQTPPLSPDAVAQIKQVQRVYRLTPDFAAGAALIAAGLDSAVKIARVDEDQFVADHAESVGGLTAARDIHRIAAHYASEVLFTLTKFHQNLNVIGGVTAVPGPVDFSVLDPREGYRENLVVEGTGTSSKFPNWVTLFGDLNKCACKHCQTVLSPGAYMIDLLEFVDGAPKKTLFDRRPDLVDIEITCSNTHTMVPYIDLVNEVLEAVVSPLFFLAPATTWIATMDQAAQGVPSAMTALRGLLTPRGFVLGPRAVVKHGGADQPGASPPRREWIVEDEAWRITVQGTPAASQLRFTPAPQTSSTNDSLEVFPEHFNFAAYSVLESAVFPFNLPLALGKEEADVFLKQKNVGRHELLETLTAQDPQAALATGVGALPYLNLALSEAQAILGQTPGAEPWTYWGFESNAASLTIPRPDKPTIPITATSDTGAPNTRAWIKLLSLVPVFMHRTGLTYNEVVALLDTEFVHRGAADPDGSGPNAPHGLHIVAADDQVVECNYNEFQIAHLTAATLGRISFFVRLWRKLGWSMRELDRYLMTFEGGSLQGDAIPTTLVRLFWIHRLSDTLEVPARTIFAWYRPLDVRRTELDKKSLYDETFLVGPASQPEYQAFERVLLGEEINLADPASGDVRAHLRASLELKAAELERLLAEVLGGGTTLDLEALTQMFRVATFASALRLSISEFYDLVALTGTSPLPAAPITTPAALDSAILATYAALREFERARSMRMSAAAMTYVLREDASVDVALAPSAEALDEAALALAAAGAQVAAAYPERPNPDAAQLTTALSQVMPQEKVVRALQIVERLTTPIATEDREFLTRYFSAFVPDPMALDAMLTQIAGAMLTLPAPAEPVPDVPSRYALVWQRLDGFLVEQARTNAALTVAAELMSLPRDTADALLTQALGSVATPPRANALEDWKALLEGGWGTGDAVITNEPAATWTSRLVPPRAGTYRFVARATGGTLAPAAVTLTIDGETVPGTASPTGDTVTFEPRLLKARTVYDVTFTYAGAPPVTVSLLWRIDNADPVSVPATAVVPFQDQLYLKLYKAAALVRGLRLDKPELQYLLENRAELGLDLDALPLELGDLPIPWTALGEFIDRIGLNRSVALDTGTVFELWQELGSSTAPELAATVAARTSWDEADVLAIRVLLSPTPARPPAWNAPDLWFVLRAAMRLVGRLDLRVEQILSLLVSAEPTLATASTLRSIYRSQFSKDTWKDAFKPLRDKLRQRQRDALTGYLTSRPIERPNQSGSVSTYHFTDENDLFAHFLIDVEMEPDTLISRIVLALNAIQLFVHRVFLGLEDESSLVELSKAKEQWVWMQRYRVWEANRKVFLYPENWIEPELRDDKTEFFSELEQELLQGEVTHERGLAALRNYLEKMSEVSNLEVVGSYVEQTFSGGVNYILHVVGRTRFQSRTFYYRTFEGKQAHEGKWNPWRKINLEIEANVVSPVVFNGRLYLVWPTIQLKEKPNRSDGAEITGHNVDDERAEHLAEIRVMWSEYVAADNKWSKPRLSKTAVYDPVPSPFDRSTQEERAQSELYNLKVDATSSEFLSVSLVKVSLGGANIAALISLFPLFSALSRFFSLDYQPRLLGNFRLWYTGEDTLEAATYDLDFGLNWPIGTLIKHNAAVEFPITPSTANSPLINDIGRSDEKLQFKSSAPFFYRTPGEYRIFGTNFPYVGGPDYRPFFYETNTKSLFARNLGVVTRAALSQEFVQVATFGTFNHPLVQEIQKRLQYFGPEAIMHRLTQALPVADNRYYSNYYYNYYGHLYLGYHIAGDTQAWWTTQRLFEAEFVPRADSVQRPYPLPTVEFGYGTPFGVYNWELFFHLPMLIAERLSENLKFEDAMKWYHYVFDPKQELHTYEKTKRWVKDLPPGCRYWNFLPFFANKDATDSLLATLGLKDKFTDEEKGELRKLIEEWKNDPFKPHLIARQRLSAYQKNVVMKYLDNLIAWADQLFRLDTFESINQATQLYILAADLLGKRPEDVSPLTGEPKYTYRELKARGIDDFANAIVEVENLLASNQEYLKTTTLAPRAAAQAPIQNTTLQSFYFCVPRNERLDGYWSTVADRLFKIRNSMNIDGVKRQLALFEPPIDPALLVKAAAAGLDLGSVLAQLNAPLPCYRFSVWVSKATELCNELKSFGGALLSALEKKDAEALQLLRQGHEIRMLELVRRVRQLQIKEAEENIEALERSRVLAEERHEEYRNREKINGAEQTQITLTAVSTGLETAQGALHTLAGILALIPDFTVGAVGPFPSALVEAGGGDKVSSAMNSAAQGLGTIASLTRGLANLAGITAGHERRWEDWKFQERLAQKEIEQIDQQIVVARVRLDIAERELENHETQMEHAAEVREFLRDKFTSQELYNWMARELSRTYQQVYKLAYDAAKTAERTFQFELGTSDTDFIQFEYRDNLRQGLLAGERLGHDLKRMDVAYLERNKREFEVTKPISLAAINPGALQDLREKGTCNFELPELLFDLDFPGQYFRRIKAVRLTIPCVTGPHTSVSAKLSLLGSAIRKDGTIAAPDDYPYEGPDDPRFVHDLVGIQSIATSTAQGDAGLFELNFRDERYLPFEGGGAVSRWRLELPTALRQFDYNTVSDVVVQLSYTARDGGGLLKLGAEADIADKLNRILAAYSDPETGLVRVLSLRKEFPDVFHRLLSTPDTPVDMTLLPEHFPFLLRDQNMSLSVLDNGAMQVRVQLKPQSYDRDAFAAGLGVNLAPTAALPGLELENDPKIRDVASADVNKGGADLLADWAPETWTLRQQGLSLDTVNDISLVVRYTVESP